MIKDAIRKCVVSMQFCSLDMLLRRGESCILYEVFTSVRRLTLLPQCKPGRFLSYLSQKKRLSGRRKNPEAGHGVIERRYVSPSVVSG